MKIKTVVALFAIVVCCLGYAGEVHATSAQIELTEPVLIPDGRVHGDAFFGVTPGSQLYDTAGDLGATIPLGTAGSGSFYFLGDIFTWVENPGAGRFEPKRVVYTLEPGYYYERERDVYRFFIKHQSFHDVDSSDDMNESYELLGVSYRRLGDPEYSMRVGRYVNPKDVDYEWDIAASATFPLKPINERDTYLELWLHHVTEDGSLSDRDGFTDYAVELGLRWRNGTTLFARYEFLHDIDRFAGTSDHQVMIGPRYTW